MEVIISVSGNGFYVYDDQLNQTQVSDSILLKFAGFCDADNDDFPEIIYEVKEGSRYYLTARNILDSVVFKLPLVKNNESYSIADKENNGKVDILLNSNGYLNNIELVENSKIWSWEGELGNLKINGMFMQPAFYKSNDTVYWSDNISIPDTFEIPAGATVIVKPGTHVYAKEGAEFIVFGKLIAKGTEFHPINFTANIMGAGKSHWGGITAKTNGIVQLEYCQIENAVVGLFLYSSKPANVENNTFKNNRVGLCAYASSPRIIENYFTQNSISIACQASSRPYLVGGTFSNVPYYNGIINNDTAIAMYNSIPSIKNGHNDIYNDTLGIYLIFINDSPLNKLNISSNYYGSSDTNAVKSHLYPSSNFIIIPLLNSAQTNFKNLTASGPEELLGIAYTLQHEQQYESAIQVFEQLIQTFPESNEALFSITGEFECFREGGLSWSEFIVNMDNMLQDTVINTSLEKYASEYKNLALRIDGQFLEAIRNYEALLKNPVSYYDSLYAIINLSNALIESGRYKSTTIPEGIDLSLRANDVSHIIRTKELLFSKLKDKSGRLKKEGCVKIERVYPNPTNSSFTTEYTTRHEGITIIELYSSSGIKVLSKQVNNKPGQNMYYVDNSITAISFLKPGIYLLKVTNNNLFDSQRIIIY